MTYPATPITVYPRGDTNLPIILYAVRQKLITDGVYGESDVYIGVKPDTNLLQPSIDYAVIAPLGEFIYSWETNTTEGQIQVQLWHKLSVDIALRQNINLTKTTGITQVINNVVYSLNLVDFLVDGQWILAMPFRLQSQGPIESDQEWSNVSLIFRVNYGYDPTIISPTVNGGDEYTQEYSYEFI